MDVAQTVVCLLSIQETLDSTLEPHNPGMLVCACNPSTQKVETRRPEVQGHPHLYRLFQ